MKLFLCLVCLVVVFGDISASPADANCKHGSFGSLPLGQSQPSNFCGQVTCKENGEVSVERCVQIIVAPGTKIIPEDLSKPFPECCERAVKTPL